MSGIHVSASLSKHDCRGGPPYTGRMPDQSASMILTCSLQIWRSRWRWDAGFEELFRHAATLLRPTDAWGALCAESQLYEVTLVADSVGSSARSNRRGGYCECALPRVVS